jgi:putative membrane protein
MKPHFWTAVVGVLAVGGWAGGVPARADDGPVTNADYLTGAITHAATEGRAGKLALKRAKSEELRQFARKVLEEQATFDPPLESLAADNKVPVLENQADGWRLSESRLGELSGDRFDREALKLFVSDLEPWIDLSQRSARRDDAAESALAAKMLPTLRQRLREANRLLKTLP